MTDHTGAVSVEVMHIYRGTIISCDAQDHVWSYLVEEKGRIAFTGEYLPRKYQNYPVTDLEQRALVPAFADSHTHFSSFALFLGGINVAGMRSNREMLEHLSRIHQESREDIIIGFGLSPHFVEEGCLPERRELDKAAPDSPVVMVKYDGHSCVVNSLLLKMLPGAVKTMRGYEPERGEMRQEAFFAVVDYVTGSISPLRLIKNNLNAYDYMTDHGFGMVHSVSGVGYPRDLDVDLERWVARSLKSGLQTRVFFQTMDTSKVLKRKLPRIGGCFATALDGCLGSQDAALHAPYEGSDNRGILFYSDEEVGAFCKKANRLGLQIQMHAIGDAAFDQAARALDAALKDYPREDHRHGIIHACLPTEEGMDICARREIQIPVQPSFLNWPQEPPSYLHRILGERKSRLYPFRTLWERGILLSGGSDAPVTFPNAVQGIHCACNHPVASEALTVQQALKLYTINGYKASFDERERGSLVVGKAADMTIISANPLTIPKEKLHTLKVEKTLLQGKTHLPHNNSPLFSLFRGIFSRKPV